MTHTISIDWSVLQHPQKKKHIDSFAKPLYLADMAADHIMATKEPLRQHEDSDNHSVDTDASLMEASSLLDSSLASFGPVTSMVSIITIDWQDWNGTPAAKI